MLVPHNALVAVADGAKLTLFRNRGREGHLELEQIETPALHPHAPSSGGHHHASTANPDHGQLGEDAFAAAVSAWLDAEVQAGRIEKVFVIASARTLGEMRPHYSTGLKAALLGEEHKELVGHDIAEVTATVNAAR